MSDGIAPQSPVNEGVKTMPEPTDVANTAEQPQADAAQPGTSAPLWVRVLSRSIIAGWAIAAILTALMGITIVVDVTLRNLGVESLRGVIDMTRYWWMPPICFLTMGIIHMRNEQIRVALFTEGASKATVRRTDLVTELVVGIFILWCIRLEYDSFRQAWLIGEHGLGATWVVLWPSRLVVLIGLCLLLAGVVLRLYALLSGRAIPDRAQPEMGDRDDL